MVIGHLISLNKIKLKILRYVHEFGNIMMPNVLRKRLLIRIYNIFSILNKAFSQWSQNK